MGASNTLTNVAEE